MLQRGIADLTILGEGVRSVPVQPNSVSTWRLRRCSIRAPAICVTQFAEQYAELRKHKGVTVEQAREIIPTSRISAPCWCYNGMVDGMVSGAAHTTAHTIRPAFEIIKTAPGVSMVSSVFLMCLADRVLAYGDCAVVRDPTVEQLADIAITSADRGAVRHRAASRDAVVLDRHVRLGRGRRQGREATELVRSGSPRCWWRARSNTTPRSSRPSLPQRCRTRRSPASATVFIFPDLNTGNNAYKAVQRNAGRSRSGRCCRV